MSFRAKPVIPQLVSALRHADPKVRAMVAEALGMACRENDNDEIALPGLCDASTMRTRRSVVRPWGR